MAGNGQVQQAQFVATQTVRARLLDHCAGVELEEDAVDDLGLLLQLLDVADAGVQGEVDGVAVAGGLAHVVDAAAAGEEVALLVQAEGQHAARGLERFLDPVPVVAVDVDLQHPVLFFQQFDDCQDTVVDPAKTR